MFTIGRENELKNAINFVGSSEKAALLIETIDAIHDFLEGRASEQELKAVIRKAFVEGKSGTWESAGSWLRKITNEYPDFVKLWEEFAIHKSSKIRFRVAAHINELPDSIFTNLCQLLLNDKSAKVRSKVAGDLYFSGNLDALHLLRTRQEIEESKEVLESIEFAIEGITQRA
ncbi:hypothetical protein [Zooshikella ganghwensis]|uniref:hypothetical protein n=1 Tax=Zooshikella ganghwensis TaxID=202772 RepID=UPI00040EB643|nr:hypothetical protein [Zooshikella ganghwensis]